jgi:hypothetical protein
MRTLLTNVAITTISLRLTGEMNLQQGRFHETSISLTPQRNQYWAPDAKRGQRAARNGVPCTQTGNSGHLEAFTVACERLLVPLESIQRGALLSQDKDRSAHRHAHLHTYKDRKTKIGQHRGTHICTHTYTRTSTWRKNALARVATRFSSAEVELAVDNISTLCRASARA